MIDKRCLVEVGIYRLSACALRIPHDFIFINPPSLEVATWSSSTCRHIQIGEATSIKECIEVPAKILKKYEQVTKKAEQCHLLQLQFVPKHPAIDEILGLCGPKSKRPTELDEPRSGLPRSRRHPLLPYHLVNLGCHHLSPFQL